MFIKGIIVCSCTERMVFALQQLFKTPQNNLRLFKVSIKLSDCQQNLLSVLLHRELTACMLLAVR